MNALLKKLSTLLAVIAIAFSAGAFLPGCETDDVGNGNGYEELEEDTEELGEGIEQETEEFGEETEELVE